jgi:hypothetical protein
VVHGEGDVRGVSLEGLDAAFREVAPDFDSFVVASRTLVWLVHRCRSSIQRSSHRLLVGVKPVVRYGVQDRPDFDGAVEVGGSKGISDFWVDSYIHNVVGVAMEELGVGQTQSRRNLVEKQIIDYPVESMGSIRIHVLPWWL